ncbi:MAG: TonB-dependent receptor [Pseudomonadota bacterium]
MPVSRLGFVPYVFTLALCTNVLAAEIVFAQDLGNDEIIVTSSRVVTQGDSRLSKIVSDLSETNVLDALDAMPSVTAFNNGGAGGNSFLSIRGGEPNFTLVLLDGIRLNDPTNSAGGAFDFGQVNPAFLEDADVTFGASSSIHGADALSGVVHLKTLSPNPIDTIGFQTRQTLNSRDGYSVSGNAQLGWKSGGVVLGVGTRDTGDITPDSELKSASALLRLRQDLWGGTLDFTAYRAGTDRTAYAEDSGGARSGVAPVFEDRETQISLGGLRYVRPISETTQLNGSLNVLKQTALSDIPAIPSGVLNGVPARRDDTDHERWQAQVFTRTDLRPNWRLAVGAEYSEEIGEGDGTLDIGFPLETNFSQKRNNLSAFAETSINPHPKFHLNAAVRLDRPNEQSVQPTYKLQSTYRATEWLQLQGSFATSYKLPSIFALSFPLIANPSLEPEEGESLELGLILKGDRLGQVSITAHDSTFKNLVDFDPVAFTNVNRRKVQSRGIEIVWDKGLSDQLNLLASVSYADVETSSGQPLRNRPEFSANSLLNYQYGEVFSAHLEWKYSSDFLSSSVPTGFLTLDKFHRVDIGVNWSPGSSWRLSLDVLNAFNESYGYSVGILEPKRTLSMSLDFNIP